MDPQTADIKLCSVTCTLVGIDCTTDMMIASVMVAAITILLLFIHEKKIDLKRKMPYSCFLTAAFFLLEIKN